MTNLKDQIQMIIDKAHRSLSAAHRNFDAGDYDFAASRAYYAVFYSMEAVLLTKNLTFSKHSGIISAFNLHFVKEGYFPKTFGKSINQLFSERQTGDYDLGLSINETDAKTDVEIAEQIVEAIVQYSKQEGFAD